MLQPSQKLVSRLSLAVVAVAIVTAISYLEARQPGRVSVQPIDQAVIGSADAKPATTAQLAKEIVAPAGFINTAGQPITIQQFIGTKVVLVDFWTYSCINCQRTLPYVTAWYEKYKDQGLEVIGIHTPEFDFEKDIHNVQKAVDQWQITYPVVLDNDYGTWQNYKNLYWPRKYLIDISGAIVYDHIGEGGYAETEKKIQALLTDRLKKLGLAGTISSDLVNPTKVEVPSTAGPLSPETYFGSARNTFLANGTYNASGVQDFIVPTGSPKENLAYLSGRWDISPEFATNLVAGAKIIYKFNAAKVFLVASAAENTKLTLLLDGKPVTNSAGSDVVNSQAEIKDDTLYRLIENATGYGQHTLEIIITQPGVKIFTLTFG